MVVLKKALSVILKLLLGIGIFVGAGIGIAALTCLIFMLIVSGISGGTPITFDAYLQLLGEGFWGFLLIAFVFCAIIAGIINGFNVRRH